MRDTHAAAPWPCNLGTATDRRHRLSMSNRLCGAIINTIATLDRRRRPHCSFGVWRRRRWYVTPRVLQTIDCAHTSWLHPALPHRRQECTRSSLFSSTLSRTRVCWREHDASLALSLGPLVLGVIALLKRHLELQALHRVLETKQQRQATQTLRLLQHLLRAGVVCKNSRVHQLTVPCACDITKVKP